MSSEVEEFSLVEVKLKTYFSVAGGFSQTLPLQLLRGVAANSSHSIRTLFIPTSSIEMGG